MTSLLLLLVHRGLSDQKFILMGVAMCIHIVTVFTRRYKRDLGTKET